MTAWDTAADLPDAPPESFADIDVIVTSGGRYWECGAAGFHLMVGWLAGPDTLRRWPEARERTQEVVCHDPDGTTTFQRLPLSGQDLRELHDDEDAHLAECGIPPRPRGFRWFQRLPDGLTAGDVLGAVNRALLDSGTGRPAEDVALAWPVLRDLYGLTAAEPPAAPPPPPPPGPVPPQAAQQRERQRLARAEEAAVLARPLRPSANPPDRPRSAVPILLVDSLRRALPFYARLGFTARELSGYAVLACGDVELHLSQTGDRSRGGCAVHVADPAALHARLRAEDTPGLRRLDVADGLATFELVDPDGNRLMVVGPAR